MTVSEDEDEKAPATAETQTTPAGAEVVAAPTLTPVIVGATPTPTLVTQVAPSVTASVALATILQTVPVTVPKLLTPTDPAPIILDPGICIPITAPGTYGLSLRLCPLVLF